MHSLEIQDETVVVVDPDVVLAMLSDRRRWREWWPDCRVVIVVDRGVQGIRWAVTGALVGYTEVVLTELPEGLLIRYTLAADPTVPGTTDTARVVSDSPFVQRELDDLRRRQVVAWKRTVWSLEQPAASGRQPAR